jgi:hypothetical protein
MSTVETCAGEREEGNDHPLAIDTDIVPWLELLQRWSFDLRVFCQ